MKKFDVLSKVKKVAALQSGKEFRESSRQVLRIDTRLIVRVHGTSARLATVVIADFLPTHSLIATALLCPFGFGFTLHTTRGSRNDNRLGAHFR